VIPQALSGPFGALRCPKGAPRSTSQNQGGQCPADSSLTCHQDFLAAQGVNFATTNLLDMDYGNLNARAGNCMSETVMGAVLFAIIAFQFPMDNGMTFMGLQTKERQHANAKSQYDDTQLENSQGLDFGFQEFDLDIFLFLVLAFCSNDFHPLCPAIPTIPVASLLTEQPLNTR
jgi:hypothetical protein